MTAANTVHDVAHSAATHAREAPALYQQFIQWIGDGTGLPDTILHIHAGMAVLMIARLVTRRSLGSVVPLSVVIVAEAFNEIMDRLMYGSWRWDDTLGDVANTLFWPTAIFVGIRLRPMLDRRRRRY
ncbi:hypothetical protein GCM10011380_15820 [Sphingomonas metalli]|uniref:Uncharacterized protein n=1 Tax=Sphingomonas metalli TaxID=1779358 RepID=A0A916T1P3_9SPHN|nr:hypothetical protein [Sphingomonas metalli]GGB27039.1 hypothetical protein GCM10011380_15820 [Sphingomonas metalli]